MRRTDGEASGKHRSFSNDAADVDRAAMNGDELANEGEADTGTLVCARRDPLDAVKSIEHVVEIRKRDANTCLLHAKLHLRVSGRECHPDRTLKRELERVREQVENNLLHISRST